MTEPRGWIYTTSRDMTFKSRAPDQFLNSESANPMVLRRSPGHREVTDFLGTGWRQPRPSGLGTVDGTRSRLSHSRNISTHGPRTVRHPGQDSKLARSAV